MTHNKKKTGWLAAAALVAGNMIGTGVFTSLGFQLADLPPNWIIGLLWALGGVAALCGALCYAELGAALPARSGGEYHLLGQTWHPLAGFLSGWVSLTVGFAAPVALASSAFGTYAANAFFEGSGAARLLGSFGVLTAATLVHLFSVRMSGRFQLAATLFKIAAILALIIAGWMAPPVENPLTAAAPGLEGKGGGFSLVWTPGFAVALFFVAYSYSGWNAAAYIAGELERPARDLPRALLAGTAAVTVLYVLFNLALIRSTPAEALRGQMDVALVAAKHLFGDAGGRVMGALISLGLVSAVSGMMWAGPRVAAVMGQDWRVFAPLARETQHGVPWAATVWQFLAAALFLAFGGFAKVLTYIEFTLSLSTFLTVAGVFWLRWKRPDLPRPFKAWGYPVTPLIFLAATGYALVRYATHPEHWASSFLGLGTVALGAVIYALAPKRA